MANVSATEPPRRGGRERPLSVSEMIRGCSRVLERTVGSVWVEGEAASVTRPASGHLYFVLKDGRSSMRAVMWRSDARRLKFRLEEGQVLRCRGHVGIYEQGGKFQFYVQVAEPAGLGAEALAFEQLKAKLAAEGLFDQARKRPLPRIPCRIGVVTSKSGAAVRDIIQTVQRRFPIPILVADAQVQGPSAPRMLVWALRELCSTDVDLVIIGRGGGSQEDLSAFNDERVVREVAACPVPIISAVGHEIDISLTDLAADHRAATPTMAGEMAVPVRDELAAALQKEERRLQREMALLIRDARAGLEQQMDQLESRLHMAVTRRQSSLAELRRRLEARHPHSQLVRRRAELGELVSRAEACARRALDGRARQLADLAGRLDAMSPLRVLDRGYALATRGGHVVADAAELDAGERLEVKLARGRLECTVDATHSDDDR